MLGAVVRVWSGDRDRDQRRGARRGAARGLALDVSLAEIVRALAADWVRPLVIKGPGHARWLYDDPAERRYGDIDLLVAPADFDVAYRCVAVLGFEPVYAGWQADEAPLYHERLVRGDPLPAVVELHRTLPLQTAPAELVWRCLSEGARTIEVAGAEVRVPGAAPGALIVALHAAQHGIGWAKPIADLERAVERVDLDTWRQAAAIAQELGAAPAFAVGLCLTPGGCSVAGQLQLSGRDASRSVRLRARTPPHTALGIERLFATPGFRARVRLLAHELVPSPAHMRYAYPLARRGRLGLVGSYVLRPVELAVKLPRGVAAWLKTAMPRAGRRHGGDRERRR
jgi:hypothetical protein